MIKRLRVKLTSPCLCLNSDSVNERLRWLWVFVQSWTHWRFLPSFPCTNSPKWFALVCFLCSEMNEKTRCCWINILHYGEGCLAAIRCLKYRLYRGKKVAFGARQACAGCVIRRYKKRFDWNVSELRLASCSTICCCDGDTKGDIDGWSNMLAPVEPLTIDIYIIASDTNTMLNRTSIPVCGNGACFPANKYWCLWPSPDRVECEHEWQLVLKTQVCM